MKNDLIAVRRRSSIGCPKDHVLAFEGRNGLEMSSRSVAQNRRPKETEAAEIWGEGQLSGKLST